jgi:hypothetical protein
MKAAGYTCEICGVKRSLAKGKEVKVEAHHRHGIDWEAVIDIVFERILVNPEEWQCLCEKCHTEQHEMEKVLKIADEVGI